MGSGQPVGGMGGMKNPVTGNPMTGIGPGHPLYDPGGIYTDNFSSSRPPSGVPFGTAIGGMGLGQSPGGFGVNQPFMPQQPYAGLTNTAAMWGPTSAGYAPPPAPTNAGYLQGQQQMQQPRVPGYQQVDQHTLSGLGNFNPGGLGGPGMNSPYWQPPQGGMPQPAMPNPSQSLPGPQQQGLLMPAFAQPFMQGQGMSARKFMRSGMPYQLLQNPQTAGMAGPALGAMTRGATMPTGYVPVVGGKPWLRQYG